MLASALCIDVIETFKQLQIALAELETSVIVDDQHLPIWFQCPRHLTTLNAPTNRHQAATFIRQLEYLDGQDPREILVGPGLVAASHATLQAIHLINHCKRQFKSAMLALKAAKISMQDPILKGAMDTLLAQNSSALRPALKKMGLARLHLKQCYRLIPTLNERPHKVSWTWAHTRAIKRISVAEADSLLSKQAQDAGIALQRSRLSKLSPSEPLAIVQELAPHLRANLLFATGTRKMIKGPVPLFYPHKPGLDLPQFTPPKEKGTRDTSRVIRNDVKLEPEPFLPAIRAHRYQQTNPACANEMSL